MDRPRIRRVHVHALVAALAAAGCSAPSSRVFSVDSYPSGAHVRLLVDGHTGQTPIEKLRIGAPAGKPEVLLIEMENYQTVAYPVGLESPDHLFFCLQKMPDLLPLQNAITELQNNVRSIRETVEATRDAEKKGGN